MNLPQANGRRFRVEARLGGGGMGDVYRAFDTERGQLVALKTLRHVHPKTILQFKAEFRTLANVAHPNLVGLYDLVNEGDEWFFTMELLGGNDFLSYVRGQAALPQVDRTRTLHGRRPLEQETETAEDLATQTGLPRNVEGQWSGVVSTRPAALAGPPRLDLLRPALRQLATGLHFLHGTGHLHRDVKPSNVLVTPEGRVVLVDFGIIAEVGDKSGAVAEFAGTPAYMAPEQASRTNVPAPASDWYSLGVLLFAALAGYVPFQGDLTTILKSKAAGLMPELDTVYDIVRERAPDLVALCRDLLHPDPTKRPSGQEIVERLRETDAARVDQDEAARELSAPNVVGREKETARLAAALEDAVDRRGNAVLVRGVSGMGKSALIEDFLARVEARGDVEILTGRCYESESVPYKTLDSLVDSLCRSLEAGRLTLKKDTLPADAGAIAQVFPVLQQLPAFADAARASAASQQMAELQRRAFAAFLDLLRRLADRRTLLLYIDDLQWGDTDTLPVLFDLLRSADRRILFLGAYRSEESDKSPVLRAVTEHLGATPEGVSLIDVAPLSLHAIAQLVADTLGKAGTKELVHRIAEDSGGHPYLAHELARYASTQGHVHSAMSLEAVIRARVGQLSSDARKLLEVVTVAGRPIANVLVQSAAQLSSEQRRAFAELRAGRFIRTNGSGASDTVEAYHDRIRETVVADLDGPRRREHHLRLAMVIEASMADSDETVYELAHHYYQANAPGEEKRTYDLNVRAASIAAQHNAFAHAHEYLVQAEKVGEAAGIEKTGAFLLLLGDVAARTGREEQAAAAYDAGLARSKDALERARLRMGMARMKMAQLDLRASRASATEALKELGDTSPQPSFAGLLRSLGELLSGVRALDAVTAPQETTELARTLLRERVIIHDLIGYIGYFEMDNLRMLQALARNSGYVAALGPSYELSNWHSLAGVTCAVIGRREWAISNTRRARDVAQQIGDPLAAAYAAGYAAHALNIVGEPIAAERSLLECLEGVGYLLPNMNYLTAVADYAWVTMMRGYPARALAYIDIGRKRLQESARSSLTEGHTYRCYAGPAFALLGREREGRAALADFGVFLESAPHEPWRHASFHSHRILFAALAEDDALLEESILAHAKLGLSPKKVRLHLRQGYLGVALARVRQLETATASGRAEAIARGKSALGVLEQVSLHPTMGAHYQVLLARFERLRSGKRGAPFERALARASSLAERFDNAWVRYEVMIEHALAHRAAGRHVEAKTELDRAAALADEHGWGRMQRQIARLREG